jgi:hypothetical protein
VNSRFDRGRRQTSDLPSSRFNTKSVKRGKNYGSSACTRVHMDGFFYKFRVVTERRPSRGARTGCAAGSNRRTDRVSLAPVDTR